MIEHNRKDYMIHPPQLSKLTQLEENLEVLSRITKSPQAMPGMTMEEYTHICGLLALWLKGEAELANETDHLKTSWYCISTFNLADGLSMDECAFTLRTTKQCIAYSRLRNVYLHIALYLGSERLTKLRNDLQLELITLGAKESTVYDCFHSYPVLVLVPLLKYCSSEFIATMNG